MGWGEGGEDWGARSDFRIEAVPTIYEHVEDFFSKIYQTSYQFFDC